MTLFGLTISRVRPETETPHDAAVKRCEALGHALNSGDVGEMVDKVQRLILDYYGDVQGQAIQSFKSAKMVAILGFCLLIGTVTYVVFVDLMPHLHTSWFVKAEGGMSVGAIGVISGALVEFIAYVHLRLYARAAQQFGAFHICLERTYRYLVAYKIADKIGTRKDETLEKLVCIMANAPMITRQDIVGVQSGSVFSSEVKSKDATDTRIAPQEVQAAGF